MARDNSRDPAHAAAEPPRALLAAVDVRLVALTALFGLATTWVEPALAGRWLHAAASIGAAELCGFLIVGIAWVLLRVPWLAARRPLCLAIAVVAGSLLARAITLRDAAPEFGPGFPGGQPTYWTLVWFLGRLSILYWGFLATAWYFAQRADERRHALYESEILRSSLDRQVMEARVQVLLAQTEPHFLFNSLAHLGHLYRSDPPLARRMLDSLSGYLGAALPHMRGATAATLGSEIAMVSAYLDVQRVRMGERLAVEIDVPEAARKEPFPPMMLASLVENAIKHGLDALPEGGTVRVVAQATPQTLRVMVADSGVGFSAARGTGVGLANIRARLAALYGVRARMTLASNAPRGVRATIEIPAVSAAAA